MPGVSEPLGAAAAATRWPAEIHPLILIDLGFTVNKSANGHDGTNWNLTPGIGW